MARNFDGDDDEVNLGVITNLNSAAIISIHAWVNLNDITSDHTVMEVFNGSFTDGFILFFDDVATGDTDTWKIYCDSTNVRDLWGGTGDGSATAGWQSVGASIVYASATGLRLYVDGAEVGDSPADMTDLASFTSESTRDFVIGIHEFDNSRDMDGQIAEVAVWNGVQLSAGDFAALAKGVPASRIHRPELTMYLPLGRGSPEPDLSGNKLVGTVAGATVVDTHPPVIPYSAQFWGDGPLIEAAAAGVVGGAYYQQYHTHVIAA